MSEAKVWTRAELKAGLCWAWAIGRDIQVRAVRGWQTRLAEVQFAVPSPCCGARTVMPVWVLRRLSKKREIIVCGQPWGSRGGRRGGCGARYELRGAEIRESDADVTLARVGNSAGAA